jgi:hypothetical protein
MNNSSVVDAILSRYGFEWHLYPYRIVDSKTQKVIFEGPHFDLSEKTLTAKRKALDARASNFVKKQEG